MKLFWDRNGFTFIICVNHDLNPVASGCPHSDISQYNTMLPSIMGIDQKAINISMLISDIFEGHYSELSILIDDFKKLDGSSVLISPNSPTITLYRDGLYPLFLRFSKEEWVRKVTFLGKTVTRDPSTSFRRAIKELSRSGGRWIGPVTIKNLLSSDYEEISTREVPRKNRRFP